jgi:uncharacterized protein YdeI (YjbR/CyaY-like superfamily)
VRPGLPTTPAGKRTRAMSVTQDRPVISFESGDAWEAWLAEHHAASPGLWLKLAKKGSGIATVSYSEALDVALCYGWIDGQKDKFDGDYWLQRFTPRRPRSPWSKINCDRVAALVARGAMQPAGLREVERAKADGRWEAAYDGQRAAAVPDDLRRELEGNAAAREFFATLDSANRYAILYRLHEAKKPETRARRLKTFVTMLSEGKKIHP